MEKIIMVCPVCHGTGNIEDHQLSEEGKKVLLGRVKAELTRDVAKKLHAEGRSYRAIAKMLGYSNPQSAYLLVNGPKKPRSKEE